MNNGGDVLARGGHRATFRTGGNSLSDLEYAFRVGAISEAEYEEQKKLASAEAEKSETAA